MSGKIIKIKKDFLVLPVSRYVGNRRITLKSGGKWAGEFTLRLDFENPTHYSYYPVSEYKGGELSLEVKPDMELNLAQRDSLWDKPEDSPKDIPERGNDYPFRPFLHFTTRYGWINDPNGLVKYTSPVTKKTVYHMFYQHNPYDWVWGNMHWGHAVSEDLLHWTHLEPALCPDENGTMFSGSAIVDRENKSGLKTGDEDVILLFYTCAGNTSDISAGKKFTQCLAYSNDGGMTFKKYENNPVVPHIMSENRDPKVVWCEELNKFLMAIYLDGNEYQLLTSDNLTKWEPLQRVRLEGDAECPDIYPLRVRGTGERKWVFSGASHHYMTGEFADGKLVFSGEVKRLSWGDSSYAAQTFSTDDDRCRIQLAWDRNTSFGDDPICGQMSMPCELTLNEKNGEYYLRAEPIMGINTLAEKTAEFSDITVNSGEPFTLELDYSAYEIDLDLGEKSSGNITLSLFGQEIFIEPENNIIRVFDKKMPLRTYSDKTTLRMIVDKGSIEVFGDSIITVPWLADYNLKKLVITGENAKISSLSVKKLAL